MILFQNFINMNIALCEEPEKLETIAFAIYPFYNLVIGSIRTHSTGMQTQGHQNIHAKMFVAALLVIVKMY